MTTGLALLQRQSTGLHWVLFNSGGVVFQFVPHQGPGVVILAATFSHEPRRVSLARVLGAPMESPATLVLICK